MNDQLLSTPNEPINDDESDISDDITDDEIDHGQDVQFIHNQRTIAPVNTFMENTNATVDYVAKSNVGVRNTNSSHVDDDDDDIDDKPKDYSLQYEDNDEALEDTELDIASHNHHDLVVDTVEPVTYFQTEGTPFETPHGISNAASVNDLNKSEQTSSSGLESPDETQLYAMEGTPGCFSRTDSVENLEDCDEKGQKEAAEGPSEKVSSELDVNLVHSNNR